MQPEIHNDEFAAEIEKICALPDVKVCLEIGSGSGNGSTQAILRGLKSKPDGVLHGIEMNWSRWKDCIEVAEKNPQFIPFYGTLTRGMWSLSYVTAFYNDWKTNLNYYPIEQVLGWYNELKQATIDANLFPVKNANGADFVLIDGSPFSGLHELEVIRLEYMPKWIALDDVNDIKCFAAYEHLALTKSGYKIHRENWYLRNGYAIFRRAD